MVVCTWIRGTTAYLRHVGGRWPDILEPGFTRVARSSNLSPRLTLAIGLLACFVSNLGLAGTFDPNMSASPNPNGGDYTVSWDNPFSDRYALQEKAGSGTWTHVAYTTGTSYAFSGKSPNDYTYRLRFDDTVCSGWPEPTCSTETHYSTTTTVTVVAAPPVPGGLSGPPTDYNGAYTVSWNASSGAASYRLEEKSVRDPGRKSTPARAPARLLAASRAAATPIGYEPATP